MLRKGLVASRRNRNMPIILFMGASLLLFLIVNTLNSLRIYVVYSSGIGPFLFIGFVLVVMVMLYIKGMRF